MVKIEVDFHYSSKKGLVNLLMLTQNAYANYAKIKLKIITTNLQNKVFYMSTILHFEEMGCTVLANFRRHFFCKILKTYFGGFIGQNTR